MTAINFPANPQLGDAFLNFVWDGEKWRNAGSQSSAVVLKDLFEFSVAADDSTQRTISTGESIKFIGAGGITTASDAEGNITIAQTTAFTGNADTVTNGVYTTGSYANPSWITSLAYSKLSGAPSIPAALGDLTDVNIVGTPSDGHVLKYDAGAGHWAPAADLSGGGGGGLALSDLDAVVDNTPSGNGSLTYNDTTGVFTYTPPDLSAYLTSADANSLTGTTLKSTVVTSSLTSVGTLTDLTVAKSTSGIALSISAEPYTPVGTQTWTFRTATGLGIPYSSWINFPDGTNQTTAWTGSAPTLTTARNINGVSFDGSADITVTAAAGTLTGTTLNSTVVTSSLTSLGSLTGLTVGGTGGDLTMTGGAITGVGNITSSGTVAINTAGGITTTATAFDIVNGTATTVNLAGAATAVNIGATTGTLTINNPTVVGTQTTQAVFDTIATTVTAFRAAGTLTIGSTSGTMTLRNPTVVGTQTTVNLWNTTSTTVNAFGAATTIAIGAATGTTTVNNGLTATGLVRLNNAGNGASYNASTNAVNIAGTLGVGSNIFTNGNIDIVAGSAYYIGGTAVLNGTTLGSNIVSSSLTSVGTLTSLTSTGSITANNATAFIAGANAVSGIALQLPSEGALRNLTNGLTNMYFDVSIGGSTQGQFQFRSSSSYTNVLTMSSTGVSFSTDATFTSRTPSLARTAFNSAIDTEITVDSMRFRISNQGGIFPQVIGNGSSRNLAWTGIGAISGTAVTQVGSTGTIVSSSAWTTLYNAHGMDAGGDTVTVTLQDKAAGRIYRITFMRSDNGSTTGYNIIGERLL